MADFARLKSTILENADRLRLSVLDLTDFPKWILGERDVHVEITVDGDCFEGRGGAKDPDLAFVKAFVEAYERAVFWKSGASPTSNGFAAHLDPERAALNAVAELVERDFFFCHYLTETPFSPMPAQLEASLPWLKPFRARLEVEDLELRLFAMGQSGGLFAVGSVIHGLARSGAGFGGILGLGCAPRVEDAVDSAVRESLRSVLPLLQKRVIEGLTVRSFDAMSGGRGPDEHARILLDCGYARWFLETFLPLGSNELEAFPSRGGLPLGELLSRIELKPIESGDDVLRLLQIHCVRAKSDSLQALFFGPTQDSCVNHARLSEFSGRAIQPEDVNRRPHPMG